jgi:hypothetical protein
MPRLFAAAARELPTRKHRPLALRRARPGVSLNGDGRKVGGKQGVGTKYPSALLMSIFY